MTNYNDHKNSNKNNNKNSNKNNKPWRILILFFGAYYKSVVHSHALSTTGKKDVFIGSLSLSDLDLEKAAKINKTAKINL